MKVLVTGSRGRVAADDYLQLAQGLDALPVDEVIHGDCPNSPDMSAKHWCQAEGVKETPFPAEWEKYGRKAGYVRNVQMLNLGRPDMVIAQWDGKSRGTLHMITEATAWGVPVRIFPLPIEREAV